MQQFWTRINTDFWNYLLSLTRDHHDFPERRISCPDRVQYFLEIFAADIYVHMPASDKLDVLPQRRCCSPLPPTGNNTLSENKNA